MTAIALHTTASATIEPSGVASVRRVLGKLRGAAVAATVALCVASTPQGAEAGVTVTKGVPGDGFDISVDWQTGYAISGFDPVSYFTQGAAIQGSSDYEAMWKGTVWAFRSSGNRDAFVADPALYAPAFGGHDPEMATRGFVAAGNPLHWMITDGTLSLFRSTETRQEYLGR